MELLSHWEIDPGGCEFRMTTDGKTAIVLGAYGLIGSACVSLLKSEGFRVVGVGRSLTEGRRCDPDIDWLERDIATTPKETWSADFANADVVINTSGALQTGRQDNLRRIHEDAITQLVDGLEDLTVRFIQISAVGVSENATTEFLRSKKRGENIITHSNLDWIILRPTLVMGPQAYGGSAMLRATAAIPLIGIRILPDTPVQTVFVEDVARAIVQAARGEIATHTIAELTEASAQTFDTLVEIIRAWQGFSPWKVKVTIPKPVIRAVGFGADVLGWLGWRSPLRTTALKALEDGIVGNPETWVAAGGMPCRPLTETLRAIPATAHERWFARLYLLLPLGVAVLAAFWIMSGLIGILSRQEAQTLLTDNGLPQSIAALYVIGGSIIDTVLGLAILYRPWTRYACLGLVAMSAVYLIGGTIWTPYIWADPLGPFPKVLPGMVLALFVAALLEKR